MWVCFPCTNGWMDTKSLKLTALNWPVAVHRMDIALFMRVVFVHVVLKKLHHVLLKNVMLWHSGSASHFCWHISSEESLPGDCWRYVSPFCVSHSRWSPTSVHVRVSPAEGVVRDHNLKNWIVIAQERAVERIELAFKRTEAPVKGIMFLVVSEQIRSGCCGWHTQLCDDTVQY